MNKPNNAAGFALISVLIVMMILAIGIVLRYQTYMAQTKLSVWAEAQFAMKSNRPPSNNT